MSDIQRYRIDAWSPEGFASDNYGRFCEYRYYEILKSQLIWSGIENAPLDKKIIVFWTALEHPTVAYWNNDHWCVYLSNLKIHPTHWMNLPDCPFIAREVIVNK